ncbi:hypothetical protein LQW54_011391 [Pestalotiopsis sp. IQ-011]
MQHHVSVTALLLGALTSRGAADCCTVEDPLAPYRYCSQQVVTADTPFLVKGINYTHYHDDLGDGQFDPDPRWDSIAVWLAAKSNRVCDDEDDSFCVVSGPVCKLIDCMPLNQDAAHATNHGGTVLTDFVVTVPGGAGPDGSWYDLASEHFSRHDTTRDLTKSVWRQIRYADNSSGLNYDNNYEGFNMTGMQLLEGSQDDGFFPYETSTEDLWPGFDLREVPCSAYACARGCMNAAWDGASVDTDAAEACIDQCAGVDDVVNYCPDVGGEALEIVPEDLGFGSQDDLDSYVPDGCLKWEGPAWPAEYAKYTASIMSAASASDAAFASSTSAAAKATATSGAVGGRSQAVQAGLLSVVPVVVKVIFAV